MIKHNGKVMTGEQAEGYNTAGSERSSFLSWLQDRVQKEMDNFAEQKAKSIKSYDEIKPKEKPTPRNQRSKSERAALIKRVDHLRDEGLTIPQACKEVGISTASYYNWT